MWVRVFMLKLSSASPTKLKDLSPPSVGETLLWRSFGHSEDRGSEWRECLTPRPYYRRLHARTHARTHAHARARTHTHTHTRTHTHTGDQYSG
jgi:hypothetical protein